MNITSKIAGRQAEICLALVREIDQAVVKSRQPADQVLAGFYRRHRECGARDRRFFSNAVFSWFRWRGWLKTPANANVAAAILLDAAEIVPQIEYMIENSGLSRAGLKPLGALNLEDKAIGLQNLLKGDLPRIEQLAPDWVSDFLFIPDDCNPEIHLRQCLESFQARPPTWLRLQRAQCEKALHLLKQAGVEIETHSLIKQAAFIKGQKNFDSALFPQIEIQDLASQCVGICCNPKPDEKWWDVCAGAGGKSLHLADLMQDNGLILATDVRPAILNQFSRRLQRNKYRSIKISLWDGAADPAPEVYFDGVLVDAPCSGLGTWARNPDARWRTSAIQIPDYANIQKNLLQLAVKKIRPGGRLVYATCTLTKAESTDVISHFLAAHSEFQLEQIINPLDNRSSAGIIRVWPWEWNCNGMFIAVMKNGLV